MRRALALAALTAMTAAAGSAAAETWKAYAPPNASNVQWSYDSDYAYRDKASGRVVALTAAGKVGADPRVGPSAPGAPDGVGSVVALDCKAGDMIFLGGYSPKKALEIPNGWRAAKPKKVDSADDKALLAAVCANAAQLAVK